LRDHSGRCHDQLRKTRGEPWRPAKASRAVGAANGANPIAIVVPCHRVIGASGALTGYAGGLERKKWLLDHEGPLRDGRGGSERAETTLSELRRGRALAFL